MEKEQESRSKRKLATPVVFGRQISPYLIAAIFFVIGIIDALLIAHFIFIPKPDIIPAKWYIARPEQTRLVDPLIACDIAERKEFQEFTPLGKTLQAKVDEEIKTNLAERIGVYFLDLDSGRWTGVNENDRFSPASLLKTPVMIAYFKAAETNPSILRQKIFYDGSSDDNTKENIKPLKELEPKRAYTVEELIYYMIQYSDNNAARLLINNINHDDLLEVFSDLGIPTPVTTADFISAKTYSLFYRELYSAKYLNRAMSQKALEILAYPDFPQGLASALPPGITVAQKFGEHSFPAVNGKIPMELHDCGIVYYPSHNYFLCVMTAGATGFDKLTNVIHDVSRLVYEEVDRNYPTN